MTYTSLNTLFVERRSITMWKNEPGYPDQVIPLMSFRYSSVFSLRGINLNLTYISLNGLLVERRDITMWAKRAGLCRPGIPFAFRFSFYFYLGTLALNLTYAGLNGLLNMERRSITMCANEPTYLNQVLRFSLLVFSYIFLKDRPSAPICHVAAWELDLSGAPSIMGLTSDLPTAMVVFGAVDKTPIDLESAKVGRTIDAIRDPG